MEIVDQTLLNALDMSKKRHLASTLGAQSNDKFISCTIESNLEMHGLPGKKSGNL